MVQHRIARAVRAGRSSWRVSGLLAGGAVLTTAVTVANLLGYLLNAVGARVLGPADFGAFGALLAVVLVGNVLALALQAVVARHVAVTGNGTGETIRLLSGWAVRAALLLGLLGLVSAPFLARFLHLGSVTPVLWLALVLVPLTMIGMTQGVHQGREHFRVLAGVVLLAAAGKVLGAIVALTVHPTVTAAMTGMALGTLVAAVVAVRRSGLPVRGRHTVSELRPLARETGQAAQALLALFVLTNIDLVLARHYLPRDDAGLYAVGAVIAKGAFWIPQAVGMLAFPALADPARRRRTARLVVPLLAATGAAVTAGTALTAPALVWLVGGGAYDDLVPHAWLFGAVGSTFALTQLLLYSRLAARDGRVGVVVWTVVVLVLLTVVFFRHDSVMEIVTTVLVGALALTAVGVAAEAAEHGFAEQTSP